jgi:hypothetical protein
LFESVSVVSLQMTTPAVAQDDGHVDKHIHHQVLGGALHDGED